MEQLFAWSLAAAAWTEILHLRASQSGRRGSGEDDAPVRGGCRCVQEAHTLLTASFGESFWTLRGLGMTIGTCWAVFGLAYLLNRDVTYGGDGSYALIRAIIIMIYASFVPLILHAEIHILRVCVRWAMLPSSKAVRLLFIIAAFLLPVVVMVVALIPLTFVLVWIDGGGIRLSPWMSMFRDLAEGITYGWLQPDASGALVLPALLLNGTWMASATYCLGYGATTLGRAGIARVYPALVLDTRHDRWGLAWIHGLFSAIAAAILYQHLYL